MKQLPHLIFLLTLASLPIPTHPKTIPYIYNPNPTGFYICLHRAGFDRVLLFADSGFNGFDEASVQNVVNARTAGLVVEVVFVPCQQRNVEEVVGMLGRSFGKGVVERYWVVPEQGDSQCAWNKSPPQNCQYLLSLTTTSKTSNIPLQIGTDRNSWTDLFHSPTGCPQTNTSLLLWAPADEEQSDGKPNFDSYRQVGGWKLPYRKLYGDVTVCGNQALLVYQE